VSYVAVLQDEAMEDAPASQPPAKIIEAPAPSSTAAPTDTTMPDASEDAAAAEDATPAAPKAHQVTADDIVEVSTCGWYIVWGLSCEWCVFSA
jgi:hypothetical protein